MTKQIPLYRMKIYTATLKISEDIICYSNFYFILHVSRVTWKILLHFFIVY